MPFVPPMLEDYYGQSGIAPGEPIIWSEEEWRSRYRKVRIQELRTGLLTIVVVVLALFVLILMYMSIVGIALDGNRTSSLLWIAFVILTVIFGSIAGVWAGINDRRSRTLGLYERGIRISPSIFLPYGSLSEVQSHKGSIRLVPRISPEGGPWRHPPPRYWTVQYELLGEEGLKELRKRTSGK